MALYGNVSEHFLKMIKISKTFLQKVTKIDLEQLLLLQIEGSISSRNILMLFHAFPGTAQKRYYIKPN